MVPLPHVRFVFALLTFCLLIVPLAAQDDVFTRARTMATSGQRTEAIALLRTHLQARVADVDARVLLGTVLSWEGQYDEARRELLSVLQQSPAYGDALAALINVEIWSGRPGVAKDLADEALKATPNDGRFLEARRRAVDAIDSLRPWGIAAGYSYDWFNDNRTAWREYSATLRRATPVGAIILRGARAERFGLQDDQFEVEMYPRLRNGTYLYVAFALAPDPVLFPEYRYAADVYQSLGSGFEAAVGVRRLQFASPTNIYVGTLNKYIGSWLLTGRMFYVPDRTGESSKSYHGSFRRYFGEEGTSYLGARYSRGFAREEIRSLNDFEVLQSDTVAAELNATISRRLTLALSATRSHQQRLERGGLRQYSASATVGLRF